MTRRLGRLSVLSLASCLTACAPSDEAPLSGPASAVRDSAGVQIVESIAPLWSGSDAWRLSDEPLFIIHASDGGEENRLLDPASIDVDSRGRIIIADGNQAGWDAILVYDSTGTFIAQAGREGEGPGEFGQLWWASVYRGDSIVGFDMRGDVLAVFDPDGRFVRQIRMPPIPSAPPESGTMAFTAGIDAAYDDGSFLAYPRGRLDVSEGPGPAWRKQLLVRLAPEAKAWDTLGVFEIGQAYWTGTAEEPLWFSPYTQKAVSGDRLYFTRGDVFEFRIHDGTGQLERIVRRAHMAQPVTDQLRDLLLEWFLDRMRSSPRVSEEALAQTRQRIEGGRFAEALPAVSGPLVDSRGAIWVEEFRWMTLNERSPIDTPTQWSVFDSTGVWLGNVETPPGFILRAVTETRALGFVVDEFDVKEVHVYGLQRTTDGEAAHGVNPA